MTVDTNGVRPRGPREYRGEALAARCRDAETVQRARDDIETERNWFCRTCGTLEVGRHVPQGWYLLERQDAVNGNRSGKLRLGLYCSVACIVDQLPRLRGVERMLDKPGFVLNP